MIESWVPSACTEFVLETLLMWSIIIFSTGLWRANEMLFMRSWDDISTPVPGSATPTEVPSHREVSTDLLTFPHLSLPFCLCWIQLIESFTCCSICYEAQRPVSSIKTLENLLLGGLCQFLPLPSSALNKQLFYTLVKCKIPSVH